MFTRTLLLACAYALTLLSCAKTDLRPFDSQFNTLEAGKDVAWVQSTLGPPALRELESGIETWHYSTEQTKSGPRYVKFQEGRIIGFGATKAANFESKSEAASPTSKGIGEKCEQDIQCESQNCHFGRCSGKNNCSVPEGKLCARSADCCTGFCDFGVCRKSAWK